MPDFLNSFVLLLVIMDPIAGMAALLSLAKDRGRANLRKIASKSILVAAIVFFLFAFSGEFLISLLGVSLSSFRAAGGLILILLGVQLALGFSFPKKDDDISEVAVVIGTPLISGPAVITTTMILVKDSGLVLTLGAGALALFIVFVLLFLAPRISEVIGRSGMQVLSTMMGIVTIAWGIQFLAASFLLGLA